MRVAVTSDFHLNPGDIFPKPEFDRTPDLVILNGDMRNFLPLGIKAWDTPEGHLTLQSLHSALDSWEVIDVFGNHEGCYEWLKWADADTHFQPVKKFVIPATRDHLAYKFVHGHQLTPDWGIIAPIAYNFIEFAVKFFPNQWYKFCKRMRWLPSNYATNPHFNLYTKYWGIWGDRAGIENCNYVIGHSHLPGGIITLYPKVPDVIDLGAKQWTIIRI